MDYKCTVFRSHDHRNWTWADFHFCHVFIARNTSHKLKQRRAVTNWIWRNYSEHNRAGIAQSVQCLTTDWTAGVRSPTQAEEFASTVCVQTGSGAHPASCTGGTGCSFLGVKRGRGVMLTTHPLLVPRLRKGRSYTSCHPNAPLWSVTGPLYLYLY
jgi:hypothetical protein